MSDWLLDHRSDKWRQVHNPTFPASEYATRLDRVRKSMRDLHVDLLLVTSPENINYLSGYQTTGYYYLQVLGVPLEAEPFAVTRKLEQSNVLARTWLDEDRAVAYEDTDHPMSVLSETINTLRVPHSNIGYERHCYFLRATEQTDMFALLGPQFTNCSGLVERLRLIKTGAELELMGRAARVTASGMDAAIKTTTAGVSENSVAAALYSAMFNAGGEYPACPSFVASGPRGSIGHATWESRLICPGDTVFIEIGGCVQRYHTAMMRTVVVGSTVPAYIEEAETVLRKALETAIREMRPGVPAGEVDKRMRAIVDDNSFEGRQNTRLGYSIGVAFSPDWGEGNILSIEPGETTPLKENMVFHVIPHIEIPGVAGLGMSETIKVTKLGGETLTPFPRKIFRK